MCYCDSADLSRDVSRCSAPPKGFIESKTISDLDFDSRLKEIQTPSYVKIILLFESNMKYITIINVSLIL